MKVADIARLCHEVNKAYCESLGDHSQAPWDEAPENIKQSIIDGVRYHLGNEDSEPSDSHDNWLVYKRIDGWVYGEVKDAEKKEHPCMVAFQELPIDQQAKDYIFHAIVKTLGG